MKKYAAEPESIDGGLRQCGSEALAGQQGTLAEAQVIRQGLFQVYFSNSLVYEGYVMD